jgi:Cu-Zn family superoxide dismutase
MTTKLLASITAAGLLFSTGCNMNKKTQSAPADKSSMDHSSMHHDMAMSSPMIHTAIAVLHPTKGNETSGVVHFTHAGDSVKVVADVEGLPPNSKHGFHIHEFGDCSSPDGASAGGHFAGSGKQHGMPTANLPERHAGDIGNLEADASGKAHLEITLSGVSINGENAILGRGVIVHAKIDDGSQPTGNAGGRIACGVIGAAK